MWHRPHNPVLRCPGLAAVATASVILLAVGCTSTSPSGSRVTVSETIENKPLSDIRMAVIKVFQKHGYSAATAYGRKLVFERVGNTWSKVAYGTWMDPTVWIRVKVDITEARPDVNVLNLNVYRVHDKGDPVLEEEIYYYGVKHKPFQSMLTEVKQSLENSGASLTNSLPAR
jgi:hypothetical protein